MKINNLYDASTTKQQAERPPLIKVRKMSAGHDRRPKSCGIFRFALVFIPD